MKPIVGTVNYKDMSPEELTRHLYQAEIERAEYVAALITGACEGIVRGVKAVYHLFHKSHDTTAHVAH